MSAAKSVTALERFIHNLVEDETIRRLTDAQLIERFAVQGDEAVFATLMHRHGRLVWGVCWHLLRHNQDAEDAFQASFLVLARKAGSIRKTDVVGSWLYGVAYRIALRAKKTINHRQRREFPISFHPEDRTSSELAWRELQTMLDSEVQNLPTRLRAPFVLCCLEGRSRKEAAGDLCCSEGTVSSRIARARALLQKRLARRGVTLSAALCAGELHGQTASANVPVALASKTLEAAMHAGVGASLGPLF